ncbi:MAG: DNA-processing protein DprA [Candidatus Peregrinibacteria bacterium]
MIDEFIALWAQWGVLQDIKHYRAVKEAFGDLARAWKQITPGFFAKLGVGAEKVSRIFKIREQLDFEWIVRMFSKLKVQLLCVDGEGYPSLLTHIKEPPPFLFVRGTLPPLHRTMGVVGTRKMTPYGRFVTEKFVADLVRNGFVIVSGLANGVDACAHEQTLKQNGLTIAVLGTGVDSIYPPSNFRLAERILSSGGAIISEFPLGTEALPHHFPQRNRIISGLSRGVLVTEGGMKSGALITAERAGEQGRDVFAVPCDISQFNLSGTNKLIQDGAKLVQNATDVLEFLNMKAVDWAQPKVYSSDEQAILNCLQNGGKTIDELVEETPFNVAQLSAILIQLYLKNEVREMGQKWVLF